MSLGDWIWLTLAALFLVVEVWAVFTARENTLTRVLRRWLGMSPLRPWRFFAVPLLWFGLLYLGWHLTVG